ncbi:MAG TPA: cytochrome c oxidase assembly protein [Caulobacteraceae bacterium]|nr:cytochrome c oxidase assembly protein [Caulobacteraceae bacterium]
MRNPRRANAATALLLTGVIAGMLGLTAAAVPLYRLFCQVTGYGGTTRVAEQAPEAVGDRTITVRFNADVDPDLPWAFAPEQRQIEVRPGEQTLAFYRARNRSERPIVGQAVYNVTPYKAGPYFSKIACFCFEEQVLRPGEEVDMPVSFYVDPAMLSDPDTQDVHTITLSYTFFMLEDETEALVASQQPAS